MTSTSVSPVELSRRLLNLLDIKPGDSIDLAKLRNGSLLISKAEAGAQQ
jgi:hypothetical protein